MPVNATHSLGTIGRFEVVTAPQTLSAFQVSKGVVATTGVWLMNGSHCAWRGTVERIVADSTCASALLTANECSELAAMVSAC